MAEQAVLARAVVHPGSRSHARTCLRPRLDTSLLLCQAWLSLFWRRLAAILQAASAQPQCRAVSYRPLARGFPNLA